MKFLKFNTDKEEERKQSKKKENAMIETTLARNIVKLNVSTKGGTLQQLVIRHAQKEQIADVVRIYNGVLDLKYEAGLAVEPRHIESRLKYDPESIFLALLDNNPCGLINVVKRKLNLEKLVEEIPKTHQLLTDNDEFISTDPNHGNVWFCPWVAVDEKTRRIKGELDGKPRSIGQILTRTVAHEAVSQRKAEKLFAYSRPGILRKQIESTYSEDFCVEVSNNPPNVIATFSGEIIDLSKKVGPFLCSEKRYLIEFPRYWVGRVDAVFTFHESNGATFDPQLVLPMGNVFDGNSLGYRTPLEYPLG